MYGNFKSHLADQLNQIYDDGLYKTEREITTPQGSIVNTIEVNNLINLCANNYLGLAEAYIESRDFMLAKDILYMLLDMDLSSQKEESHHPYSVDL